MGCIDTAQILDSHNNRSWTIPNHPTPRRAFESFNDPAASDQELPLILLVGALAGSSICSALSPDGAGPKILSYDFEASRKCTYQSCSDLPADQWKIEVNRWFEASLARIQANVFDITRGTGSGSQSDDEHEDYEGIPSRLQGICSMGKFRSVGWRNVSAWGFLGILSSVAVVTLASHQTQDGSFGVWEATRRVIKGLWWTVRLPRLWLFARDCKRSSSFSN